MIAARPNKSEKFMGVTVDPCELYESWNDIAGTSELLEGLQDLADSISEAWGLEGVTLEFGDLEGLAGQYDPNTNTITIDLDDLSDGDEALDTMFHEFMHAVHEQWEFPEEEQEELHDSLASDAGYLVDELLADCVSDEFAESGGDATIPDIPGVIRVNGTNGRN